MQRLATILIRSLAMCAGLVFIAVIGGLVYGRTAGLELMSVQSDSMAPLITTGDAVLLDHHAVKLIPGEIISYRSSRDSRVVITHRIVKVDYVRGIVQTKGDNLLTPDPPVPLAAVQGTVRYHVRFVGTVLDDLRTPAGLAAAIYLPALGIVGSELMRLRRYYGGRGSGRYVLHGY